MGRCPVRSSLTSYVAQIVAIACSLYFKEYILVGFLSIGIVYSGKHTVYGLTVLNRSSIILLMNRLDNKTRAQVIRCLVEGNSIRSTERITGVTRNAIGKLLVQLGEVCREYQDKTFRNLTCKRLQLDEIWSFCGAKQKNTSIEKKAQGWGDGCLTHNSTHSLCRHAASNIPAAILVQRDAERRSILLDELQDAGCRLACSPAE
jgi:hypothetical protein